MHSKNIQDGNFFQVGVLHFNGQTIFHFLSSVILNISSVKLSSVILNIVKCEVRFAILQNREIFLEVTLVQKLCRWNGLSISFNNWCPKTEIAYLIGCQPGFFKIS